MRAKALVLLSCLILGVIIVSCSGSKSTCPAYKSKINTVKKKEDKS